MTEARQLAAIMFTDIEGYTAMMQVNETEGRSKAKRYRNVLEDQVSKYGGRVIQNYGDGSLSTFNSAVEAVKCAQSIQNKLNKDPSVPLRIGIHLGDIIIDEGEIYGDGINIASRIESMGVAGSVLLSGSVYKEIKNQPNFLTKSLGYFDFKNVSESIEVFALSNNDLIIPKTGSLRGKFKERSLRKSPLTYLALTSIVILVSWGIWENLFTSNEQRIDQIKSIAVLPLTDLNNHDEQSYVIDGLYEGIIGSLGQLGLKIISKNTTSKYIDSLDKKLSAIAQELGVDGILRGEILSTNDSMKMKLELIKTFPREKLVWSKQYNCNVHEMLNVQRDVSFQIAKTVHLDLSPNQLVQFSGVKEIDTEVYKAYLRGMYFINKSTPENFQKGLTHLHKAVSLDPANPLAYAGLALGYMILAHGPNPDDSMWKRAKAAAMQAIKLDSTIAEAHTVLAIVKSHFEWDWEEAEYSFKKALSINPNQELAHFQYAWYLAVFGRFDEAIAHHKWAKEIDPLRPIITSDMGSLYYWTDSLALALKEAQEGLQLDSKFGHGWWVLGNVYVGMKKYEMAIEAHKNASNIDPIWKGALASTYAFSGDKKSAREVLEEIKDQEMSTRVSFWLAHTHMALGEFDSTFYWLNHQPQDWWIGFIRTWPEFNLINNDPRFHQLLNKQGLPPISTDKNK